MHEANAKVEGYLQVFVDLASFSVLPQQPPEDSHSPEPLNLGGHTGLGGTLSLTSTGVTTETLGGEEIPCSGTGVDDGGLNDTED